MVIRDEATFLKRCLESIKPLVDTYEIVDSSPSSISEQSESIVRETLNSVQGGYHRCKWVSEAYNRNIAFQFARGKSEYLLMIEPDDEWFVSSEFNPSHLRGTQYYAVGLREGGLTQATFYQLIFLKNMSRTKWINQNGKLEILIFGSDCPNMIREALNHVISTRYINNQMRDNEL